MTRLALIITVACTLRIAASLDAVTAAVAAAVGTAITPLLYLTVTALLDPTVPTLFGPTIAAFNALGSVDGDVATGTNRHALDLPVAATFTTITAAFGPTFGTPFAAFRLRLCAAFATNLTLFAAPFCAALAGTVGTLFLGFTGIAATFVAVRVGPLLHTHFQGLEFRGSRGWRDHSHGQRKSDRASHPRIS